MFHVYKLQDIRNRAYVVDNHGNKLFYGTLYQCGKFIEYMLKGSVEDGAAGHCGDNGRSRCSVVKT